MSAVSDPTVRRLCAVWFADIVGYVALSSEDEAEALEVVGIMQRLAREHIEACGGELIKFVGDAVLAAFGSTSAALRSALELRAAFAQATSQRGHELPLRIGLHVGDLSTTPDGDVYGDGVNLASRIQAAVEPGEVGVSEDVWRQLRNRREFAFIALGDEKLRGVPGRISLFAAELTGDDAPAGRRKGVVRRVWRAKRRRIMLTGAVGVTAAAAVVAVATLNPRVAEAEFPSRGWVVIADFANTTGDTIFDDALDTALRVALEQSVYVNVAPPQRLEGALQRMRRPSDSPIDAATAREIAQREGFHAVLLPSITGVGDAYTIAIRIERPDGSHLRTFSERADGRGAVLDALDRLAVSVRQYLGETQETLTELQQPLTLATTASLDALKQFTLGQEAIRDARFDDARWHFGEAIRLDSTFASALVSAGIQEWELGHRKVAQPEFAAYDPADGVRLVDAAMGYVGDVTERERLSILPLYALVVENDTAAAIAHLRRRVEQYPDDYIGHNNLGRLLELQGDLAGAAAGYRRALLLNPDMIPAYTGLSWLLMNFLGQVDSAVAWSERQVRRDSTYYMAWDQLGWGYVGVDRLEDAVRAFRRSIDLRPTHTLARFRLGHTLRMLGRHDEAVAAFREILRRDTSDLSVHYDIGVALRLAGDEPAATRHFERWRDNKLARVRSAPTAKDYAELAAAHLRLGDEAAAARAETAALARAEADDEPAGWKAYRATIGFDTTGHFELAALEAQRGDVARTRARLEQSFEHGHTNMIWALMHPDFHGVRDDARFRAWIDERLRRGQEPG